MKKILTILLVLMAVVACKRSQPDAVLEYVLEGTVPDSSYNGMYVYLEDIGRKNLLLDSVKVENNQFLFKGNADTIRWCLLKIDDLTIRFMLEPGNLKADFEKRKVSGDDENAKLDKINELEKSLISLSEKMYNENATKTHIDSLMVIWNKAALDSFNVYFDKYKNDVPLASLIQIYSYFSFENASLAKDFTEKLKDASTEVMNLPFVKDLISSNNSLINTQPGGKYIDVEGFSVDDKSVKLSDFAGNGKYVLVDFWASWCGPCRAEVPNLKKIYDKYKSKNLDIVSIAVWDKTEDTKKAIKEEKMPWNQIINTSDSAPLNYGIRGIPCLLLIAPDGTIVERGASFSGKGIDEKLKEIFK